jgi:coproporphyrinogen III oxidase
VKVRVHAQVQEEVQMQEQEQVQAEVEVTVAEGEIVVAAGVGVAVVVGEVAAIEVAVAEEFVRDDAAVLAAGVEYMSMDTSIPSSREDTSPASHSHHRVLAEGRHYTASAGAVAHADTAVVYTADIARGRGVGSSSRNALLIKAKSE